MPAAATAAATATAPVAAIAAAALASVLRWRPDGVAFVPPSAITALVNRIAAPSADRGGRLADAGGGKDGGKDGGGAGSSSSSSSMLIGDVDLLGQLRVCGADIGRALRNTKSGLPRLVGMLDAPPPGAPTAAAKAALQLDRIMRAEAEAEGAVDAGSGAERGAAALTAAAAYGGMRASVIGSSVVGGTLEVATGGRSACAVACVRCPSRVALRALGGVARLAVLLAGGGCGRPRKPGRGGATRCGAVDPEADQPCWRRAEAHRSKGGGQARDRAGAVTKLAPSGELPRARGASAGHAAARGGWDRSAPLAARIAADGQRVGGTRPRSRGAACRWRAPSRTDSEDAGVCTHPAQGCAQLLG
jgi:hypothetical protein